MDYLINEEHYPHYIIHRWKKSYTWRSVICSTVYRPTVLQRQPHTPLKCQTLKTNVTNDLTNVSVILISLIFVLLHWFWLHWGKEAWSCKVKLSVICSQRCLLWPQSPFGALVLSGMKLWNWRLRKWLCKMPSWCKFHPGRISSMTETGMIQRSENSISWCFSSWAEAVCPFTPPSRYVNLMTLMTTPLWITKLRWNQLLDFCSYLLFQSTLL